MQVHEKYMKQVWNKVRIKSTVNVSIHAKTKEQGYFRFWDLGETSPPNFRCFFVWGGGIPPPIVTNPDVISKAYVFPSEGI